MRLIDADSLMKILVHRSYSVTDYWNNRDAGMFLYGIEQAVNEQPTVDAMPVIRCSECKFVGTDATCCLVCKREGMGLKPYHVYHDDYCSYAERKEE